MLCYMIFDLQCLVVLMLYDFLVAEWLDLMLYAF